MAFDIDGALQAWDSVLTGARQAHFALIDLLGEQGVFAHRDAIAQALASHGENGIEQEGILARKIDQALTSALGRSSLSPFQQKVVKEHLDCTEAQSAVRVPDGLAQLCACIAAIALDHKRGASSPNGMRPSAYDPYPRDRALIDRVLHVLEASEASPDDCADLAVCLPPLAAEGGTGVHEAVRQLLGLLGKDGIACALLPNDFLWSLQAEAKAKKQALVDTGSLTCVIGLPTRTVPGTATNVCLVVLQPPNSAINAGQPVPFIDARNLGAKAPGSPTTLLGVQDVRAICETYRALLHGEEGTVGGACPGTLATPQRMAHNRYLLIPELYTGANTVPIANRTAHRALIERTRSLDDALGRARATLAQSSHGSYLPPRETDVAEALDILDDIVRQEAQRTGGVLFEHKALGEVLRVAELDDKGAPGAQPRAAAYVVVDATARHEAPGDMLAARAVSAESLSSVGRATEMALAVTDAADPSYMARIVRGVPPEAVVDDPYLPTRRINAGRLLRRGFACPSLPLAKALERAWGACERELKGITEEARCVEEMLDTTFGNLCASPQACKPLGDLALPIAGRDLPFDARVDGQVRVVSAFGEAGTHNQALSEGPTVVVGLRGNRLAVARYGRGCWPTGSTLWIDGSSCDVPVDLLYAALHAWISRNGPGLSLRKTKLRSTLESVPIPTLAPNNALSHLARDAATLLDVIDQRREVLRKTIETWLAPLAAGND